MMGTEISLEALRQEMRSGAMVLVGCRAAGSPNPPAGTKRGILCIGCGTELEASPTGQQRITAGAKPVCVPCATAWAELAANEGRLDGVDFGPHAEQSLKDRDYCLDHDLTKPMPAALPVQGGLFE